MVKKKIDIWECPLIFECEFINDLANGKRTIFDKHNLIIFEDVYINGSIWKGKGKILS